VIKIYLNFLKILGELSQTRRLFCEISIGNSSGIREGFGNVFFTDKSSRNHAHDFIITHFIKHSVSRITEFRNQRSLSSSNGSSYLRHIRLHTSLSPPQFLTFSVASKIHFFYCRSYFRPFLLSFYPTFQINLPVSSPYTPSDAAVQRFLFLSSSGFLSSEWNALFVSLVLALNISAPHS